ncbi:MAG: dienelactone hydrolase family protein [Woeseia sp.]
MTLQTRHLDYHEGDATLRATVAWDDSIAVQQPGVLVAHAWRGRSEFEDKKALALASLGYVGFALDVYGRGQLGTNPTENAKLMQPFMDDRALLQRRLQAALAALRAVPEVDDQRVAGIGFCFGGLCMLDLARSGADLAGVVSFHGLLSKPATPAAADIRARILLLHGWDDPMATPDEVLALSRELSSAGADWQLHAYGKTLHAFTNPLANDPANGLQYRPRAERRAWCSMQNFLAEIFE